MIGRIGLIYDAVHTSKAVDQEVVGAFVAHKEQQVLADALESVILIGFKGSLIALGVEHDTRRLGAPRPELGLPAAGNEGIPTRLARNR